MKNILPPIMFAVLFLLFSTESKAQRAHAVYIEGLGNGLLYSLNYDVRFAERNDQWGARIGVATYSEVLMSLAQVNYLIGEGKHKLELGAGLTTQLGFGDEKGRGDLAANAALMYRYQNPGGNFLFRIGLGPIFVPTDDGSTFDGLNRIFWFWPGLSLGYHF